MTTNIESLVNDWITCGNRKGNEFVNEAIAALDESNSPSKLVTLVCPNFEISRKNGQKTIEIHDSFIHDELGNLRRGYVAMEEISAINEGLALVGKCAQHSVVIIDNAIQWQPKGANSAIDKGVSNLQKLVEIQLENRGVNPRNVKVSRLSKLIPTMEANFGLKLNDSWERTAQAMWELVDEPNNPIAGILRRELPKESRYLQTVWGVQSDKEAKESLIRDQYALTALLGKLIPFVHAADWDQTPTPRNKHVLFDAILGPKEDPHNAEYALYNLSCTTLDKALADFENSPLPIIRAIKNVALWSERAMDAPIAGKTVEDMKRESWEITEKGLVPD